MIDRRYIVGGVVVLVLGLVAVALFLDDTAPDDDEALEEREAIYQEEVESHLKNAATAEESYLTTTLKSYTTNVADLEGEGLRVDEAISLVIEIEDARFYCIQATHDLLPEDHPWKVATYSSDIGRPTADDVCE